MNVSNLPTNGHGNMKALNFDPSRYARIAKFIRKHLLEPPTVFDDQTGAERPIPLRIVRLVQLSDDHRGQKRMGEWGVRDNANADDLAKAVCDRGQDIADEFRRAVDFEVAVFHGTHQVETDTEVIKFVGKKSIRAGAGRISQDDPVGLGDFNEPATTAGERQQWMRHREAETTQNLNAVRLNYDQQARMIERLEKQNDRLMARIDELETKNTKLNLELEKSRNQENEREVRVLQAQAAEKRFDELMRNAMIFLPVIANRLIGTKMFPEGTYNAVLETAKMLIKSIASNNERMMGIFAQLTEEERIGFQDLAQRVLAEEMAAQEKADAELAAARAHAKDPHAALRNYVGAPPPAMGSAA